VIERKKIKINPAMQPTRQGGGERKKVFFPHFFPKKTAKQTNK
jgi:hypothetical protein